MLKRTVTALCLLGASAAQAGILVEFTGATGNEWHYTVSMDPQVILSKAGNGNPASFFTVYDFKGLQSIDWQPENGAGTASDWLTSTAGKSPDPKDTLPGDDPNIPNATITFNRDLPFAPGQSLLEIGKLTLTGLSAGPSDPSVCVTNTVLCQPVDFGSETRKPDGITDVGAFAKNGTFGPAVVPEPSTVGLMLGGLFVVGALARRRANSSSM